MPEAEELQPRDHGEARKRISIDKLADRRGAEVEGVEGEGGEEEPVPRQEDHGYKEGAEPVREGTQENGDVIFIESVCKEAISSNKNHHAVFKRAGGTSCSTDR